MDVRLLRGRGRTALSSFISTVFLLRGNRWLSARAGTKKCHQKQWLESQLFIKVVANSGVNCFIRVVANSVVLIHCFTVFLVYFFRNSFFFFHIAQAGFNYKAQADLQFMIALKELLCCCDYKPTSPHPYLKTTFHKERYRVQDGELRGARWNLCHPGNAKTMILLKEGLRSSFQ